MRRRPVMTEQNKNEEFLKDWEIDISHKSARHITGLGFTCQYVNEDGSLRVEMDNLIPWEQKMFEKYHDFDMVDADMQRLRGEFATIYKEKMLAKENNSAANIMNAVRNNNFSRR